MRWRIGAAVLTAALVLAGCAPGGTSRPTRELTVFAAASLGSALERLEAAWTRLRPDVPLVVAIDSSAALRTQIEQGAPADVFLSADVENPARLIAAGLTEGPAVPFATNALAIVVPRDNPASLRSPRDLAGDGVRVVAAAADVPITRYVGQLLVRLAGLDGYPAWFVEGYETNVVSREDNVRAVLAKIELGEGDAAIVYRTDARAAGTTVEVPIPRDANVEARYDAVVLAGDRSEEGRAFVDWVKGPAGSAILADLGFGAVK